jgi:putative SOS response-associated peptidase YedK
MCGRFTLTYRESERRQLALELGVDIDEIPPDFKARWNIAPTDPHLIVRMRLEDRHALQAKWGLINTWAKDAKRAAAQINARAESLARNGAFKDAFARRRCVVPADGFYEWAGSGAAKQPYWFHRPEGGLLLFAGLYESWQSKPGEWQRTFTIVTTDANPIVSPIHDRMPVILPEDLVDEWLDPRRNDLEELGKLLVPARRDVLEARVVTSRVNSVKNDDEACLEPAFAPVEVPRLL